MQRINRRLLILFVCLLAGSLLAGLGFSRHQRAVADRQLAAQHQQFLRLAEAGTAQVSAGEFAQALHPLEQALALAPQEVEAQTLALCFDLATAYGALGRVDDAEKMLRNALSRAGTLRETQLARPEFLREKVRLSTGLANILLARGKLSDAEILYQRVAALSPKDAAAHNNLANVLLLEGKIAEAQPHYDIASALQPNNPEILNAWGRMLLETRRPAEAESKFRAAIALNPKGAAYYDGLGRAFSAQSRFGPALQAEATAIHYDNKFIDAFLESADIYTQLKQYRPAETYLRGALAIDRNNQLAIVALARLLAGTDDPEQKNVLESITLFRQAVDLTHGQDVNLLTQLADMYALAKYYDQAGETIDLAIQRAREQRLSDVDQEALLQHAQEYGLVQTPPSPLRSSPLTTVEAFGNTSHAPPDPFDDPAPRAPKLPNVELISPP